MNKRKLDKAFSRVHRFVKSGPFYIGTCNQEVVTGYCLDAAPSCSYIWRFALPAYDNIEFLHLSLGGRIASYSKDEGVQEADLIELLNSDWCLLSGLQDSESLIRYIDREMFSGTYALWTRYLVHIWRKEFNAAETMHNNDGIAQKFAEMRAISGSFEELSKIIDTGSWQATIERLSEWSHKTASTFCKGMVNSN